MYMPTINISPWQKLTMFITPKMMFWPIPIRE